MSTYVYCGVGMYSTCPWLHSSPFLQRAKGMTGRALGGGLVEIQNGVGCRPGICKEGPLHAQKGKSLQLTCISKRIISA